jgi:leucyl-tRNA synthetase
VSQDVHHSNDPVTPDIVKQWLPVHMYTGGAEHSVLHLLYSRFITMVLHDMGVIGFDEPFENFYAHGLVIKDGAKMSKSKGNVVNPDEYINKYGADALRMYLMFMGPLSDGGDFRDSAMEGMSRWVGRIWRLITSSANSKITRSSKENRSIIMKTLLKVSEDMPKRRYNTAIAAMMECTNALQDAGGKIGTDEAGILVRMLAPFAPHLAEELWALLAGRTTISKKSESVHMQPYPVVDHDAIVSTDIPFVIQINGKVRDTMIVTVSDAHNESHMTDIAKGRENVKKFLIGTVRKVIFVPGKLVNFVCS